ncbi:MAG TPA: hypothetical protein DCR06_09555, partial [Planctomycetaceae bacterium]|nr:hypothetical protein [Planctomycetaceae bacterium]
PEPIMPVMTSAVNVVRPKPSVGELLFDEELILLSTEHELFITFLDYLERGLLQEKDPSTLQTVQNSSY